ncbi:MAG: protein kinase [Myxococcales bacterium]|nr:protein kinase [Myxococcales bacterium]
MSDLKGEKTMNAELDPKIKIRAPLRCEGIGRLDCAEHEESGERIAVRWLPLDANGDAAARAMSQLPSHPTLPRIHQTGRMGSAAFVAMDFPDGVLLSTMLGEPFSALHLGRIGADIADVLATIHSQGVFHGELSADSLLLRQDKKAVLWDMPLVIANRLTDRRGEERLMALMVRMAAFLSPERAQGMPPSAAADVYALGAVLCLAAGGRAPAAATTLATIHQLATGKWTPEVPQSQPPVMRGLMRQMVHPDPLARPSAREVAELLSRPPQQMPTIPEMPALEPPAAEPAPARRLAPVMLAVGSAILLVGSTALFLATRAPSSRPPLEPARPAAPALSVPAPKAAASVEASAEADLIAPLPAAPKRPARHSAATVARPKAPRKAAKPSPKLSEEPEPRPTDFSFLETGVEPPTAELKRPEF